MHTGEIYCTTTKFSSSLQSSKEWHETKGVAWLKLEQQIQLSVVGIKIQIKEGEKDMEKSRGLRDQNKS